jgi:hypothetical protein
VGTLPESVLGDARALLFEGPLGAEVPPWPRARVERARDLVGRFLDYHLESRLKSQRGFLAAPNRNAPAAN